MMRLTTHKLLEVLCLMFWARGFETLLKSNKGNCYPLKKVNVPRARESARAR
jgi:hypothetical protein